MYEAFLRGESLCSLPKNLKASRREKKLNNKINEK
jgi:hypothetical protein